MRTCLKIDELVRSYPNRWLCKEAKFKARALTTTRRAGGLDFRPAAEKTKARQCLQRYVCESKQSRGAAAYCEYASLGGDSRALNLGFQ